jgi:Zn-dependent protease
MGSSFVTHLPEIFLQLIAFAFAISVHESAHGWMAERLGDPTARWLGRISLNPLRHVDLFGTVIFPLLLAVLGAPVIGWAKPVPFVSRNLRNQRWGPVAVALAGPVSNIALAAIFTTILVLTKMVLPGFRELLVAMLQAGAMGAAGIVAPLVYLLFALAMINLVLAVFNMIPVPPLDGSHLLEALLPYEARMAFGRFQAYGMILLFALMWTGIFGRILQPFVTGLLWILLS